MDEGVSTSMDALVGLLEKKGSVKMGEAVKELNTDKSHVEGWAEMLRKAGVAEVKYSVIGGAVIKKGPKFDEVVKNGSVEKPAVSEDKSKSPPKEASTDNKQSSSPPKQTSSTLAPPGQGGYSLIRKKIDDEEKTMEQEIKELKEEQSIIVTHMQKVIDETKRISEYLDQLETALDTTSQKRQDKLEAIKAK
jgi:adenylate kinase family enzyme